MNANIRKLGVIAASMLGLHAVAPAAHAQTDGDQSYRDAWRQDSREIQQDVHEIRQDRRELRDDYRELAHDRADYERAKAQGDVAAMRRERMEIRNDKREIARDTAELRRDQAELRQDVRANALQHRQNHQEYGRPQHSVQWNHGYPRDHGHWNGGREHRQERAAAQNSQVRPASWQAHAQQPSNSPNPAAQNRTTGQNNGRHLGWTQGRGHAGQRG